MGPGITRWLLAVAAVWAGLAGVTLPVDAREVSVCIADFSNTTRFSTFDPLPDNLAFYLIGAPDIKVIDRWRVRGEVSSTQGLGEMAARARSLGATVLVDGMVSESSGRVVADLHAYDLTNPIDDGFQVTIVDAVNCRDAAAKAAAILEQHYTLAPEPAAVEPASALQPAPAAASVVRPVPSEELAMIEAQRRVLALRSLAPGKKLVRKKEATVSASDVVTEQEFGLMIARLAPHLSDSYDNVFAVTSPSAPLTRARAIAALSKGLGERQHLGTGDTSQPITRQELATLMLDCYPPLASVQARTVADKPTGLVVDARGLGLERCMSPIIESETGARVYPDKKHLPSIDYIQENGIASFVHNLAGATRVGDKPLIIRAIGVKGAASQIAVISQEDAQLISAASENGGFLKEWKVTFLLDEGY